MGVILNPSQEVGALRTDFGKTEKAVITFPATAGMTQGDFVKLSGVSKTFACWLDKDTGGTGIAEATTITFPATAAATQADYFEVISKAGVKYAIWLDIDAAGTAPTGAIYVASDVKIKVPIVTGNTAIQNALAAVTAIGSLLVGFTITNHLNGTVTFTCTTVGTVTDASVKNADDSGAGSILKSIVQGVNAVIPAATIYTACDFKIRIAIATGDTAIQVAGKAYTALVAISDVVQNFDIANNGNGSLTVFLKQGANVTDPVPKNISEGGAGSITFAETQGIAIDNLASDSPASLTLTPSLIT